MPDQETHRLQPDPPEGDRATVERELKRQERKPVADKAPPAPREVDDDRR